MRTGEQQPVAGLTRVGPIPCLGSAVRLALVEWTQVSESAPRVRALESRPHHLLGEVAWVRVGLESVVLPLPLLTTCSSLESWPEGHKTWRAGPALHWL
ncbi:rCG58472 [Rattus norvegicus]|uniref:RCG58472 n=1 Tax=Rattus norvegicus TaxID=10116 RepID=A6J4K4_RAT|nr:rCG58472 [Rattus norvegicus]